MPFFLNHENFFDMRFHYAVKIINFNVTKALPFGIKIAKIISIEYKRKRYATDNDR